MQERRTVQLKYMQLHWSQLWPSKAILKTKILGQLMAPGPTERPSGNGEALPLGWAGPKQHSLSDCLTSLQAISGFLPSSATQLRGIYQGNPALQMEGEDPRITALGKKKLLNTLTEPAPGAKSEWDMTTKSQGDWSRCSPPGNLALKHTQG